MEERKSFIDDHNDHAYSKAKTKLTFLVGVSLGLFFGIGATLAIITVIPTKTYSTDQEVPSSFLSRRARDLDPTGVPKTLLTICRDQLAVKKAALASCEKRRPVLETPIHTTRESIEEKTTRVQDAVLDACQREKLDLKNELERIKATDSGNQNAQRHALERCERENNYLRSRSPTTELPVFRNNGNLREKLGDFGVRACSGDNCEYEQPDDEIQESAANVVSDEWCDLGWTQYENHCYYQKNFTYDDHDQIQFYSWHTAEKNCRKMDAHLASIHSADEWHFIMDVIRTTGIRSLNPRATQENACADSDLEAWFGLYAEHGRSKWTDGTTGDYVKCKDNHLGHAMCFDATSYGRIHHDHYDASRYGITRKARWICKKPINKAKRSSQLFTGKDGKIIE